MKSGTNIPRELVDEVGSYPVFGANRQRGWAMKFNHEGEFPLVGRQGSVGKVRLVRGRFWATEHAVVVTPRSGVDASWLARVLEVMDLGQYSQAAAIPGLSVERVLRLPAVLPPLDEQRLIAKYLDHGELGIGRALESKRRLVVLLDERRRSTTQSLVIGGTNPRGAGKYSGIEWLGDIQDHWEVRPAKFFFREVNERSVRGEEELLSVSHLTGVTPRSSKNVTMFMAASYVGHKICRKNDLVINTMWAWMGALGVAAQTGIVSPAYAVYRPLPGSPLSPSYAGLLLRTQPYVDEYTCRSTGIQASRLRLYPDQFLSVPVVCPPAAEQREIVERVERETRDLSAAIAAATNEVELLLEYRTRLIADVVTGRRDVRAEAAALPELDSADVAAFFSTVMADSAGEEDQEEMEHAV